MEGESRQNTPQGKEIPVPDRQDFMRDLRRIMPHVPEPNRDDDSGSRRDAEKKKEHR